MIELQDLPLLTAMMRERGLPVASCQLTDRRYLRNGVSQRTVVVTWASDNGFYQRDLAEWMAGCDVIHRGSNQMPISQPPRDHNRVIPHGFGGDGTSICTRVPWSIAA